MNEHEILKEAILNSFLGNGDVDVSVYEFALENMIFEERVKLNCLTCQKFNNNFTCPPAVNYINFKEVFSEYRNGLIVSVTYTCENEIEFEIIRKKSTNLLHSCLLKLEKILWEMNSPLSTSLIGGACKLCHNGCTEDICQNPSLSRVPWEATGVNIIKSLRKGCGIEIKFSRNKISRFGLIMW